MIRLKAPSYQTYIKTKSKLYAKIHISYDNRSGSPESPTHEEMMFGSVVKEGTSFNGISIFSFGGHFVQRNRKFCVILVKGIMRHISVKSF